MAPLLGLGCETQQPPDPFAPRAVTNEGEWMVEQDGELLGRLILIQVEDPVSPIQQYEARNRSGQRVGYIDISGKVYRFEPFEDDPVYLGMYPMNEALGLLFEREQPVQVLSKAEFEAREAAIEASHDGRSATPRSEAPK